MAQQTAVDFLYEFVQMKLTNEQQMQFEGLFQQAKQMEKEQIIEAYRKGVEEDVYVNPLKTGTQYFNKTFNTKNHD